MANKRITQIQLPGSTEVYDIGLTQAILTEISALIQSDSIQYLGLVGSLADLSSAASKGDFYRASQDFSIAHAGDLIIALVNNPIQELVEDLTVEAGWAVVHGGEFDMSHTHSYSGTTNNIEFEDANIEMSGTSAGSVAISIGTGTPNYTPEGEVQLSYTDNTTGSALSGTAAPNEHTHSYDKATSATISVGTGTANYTPAGSVSKPSFTGSAGDTESALANGTAVSVAVNCGEHNHTASFSGSGYTPEGSVTVTTATDNTDANSGDGISVVTSITEGTLTSGTTGGIEYVNSVSGGSASLTTNAIAENGIAYLTNVSHTPAALTGTTTFAAEGIKVSVAEEVLVFATAGTGTVGIEGGSVSPTTQYLHHSYTAPTATTKHLVYSSAKAGGTGTAAPNAHTHGYVKTTSASFSGTEKAVAGSVTVNNTSVSGSGSGTVDLAHSHSFTPAGSVSQPTFTGSGAQLVVSLGHTSTATGANSGNGIELAHSHSYSQATGASFSGEGVYLKAVFTGSAHTSIGTYKKVKTVTFSGKTGTPE